jgi:crotonobetainyl-CoA:carnitine CoA-transferase CaiB-like acyl-CoA transferase
MRRPDLADDPRFVTPRLRKQNFDELHAMVQNWIWTFDSMDAVDAQFDEAKLATGQLRDIGEFNETSWANAWVTTREVSDRHGGKITIPAPPWHFSAHDGTLMPQLPARQGEDNEGILKELGYTTEQIQLLVTSAALIEPARELIADTGS